MSIFPIIKRFQDVRTSETTAMLIDEMMIHGKSFRSGTIFFVLGWREIDNKAYLILSKGSWEGLVSYDFIKNKIETLNRLK